MERIPNTLIFTHYINLLEANATTLAQDEELVVLRDNVQNSIRHHPNARVRFLTDQDCRNSIRQVLLPRDAEELVGYFDTETTGMYKADLCRGAALLETGGLYFDVDLGVRMNLLNVLEGDTTFATVRVHTASNHPGAFFQAFIGATPENTVIRRYVELFLEYYRGEIQVDGPLGVLLLKRAFDEVGQSQTSQIFQEVLFHPDLQETLLKDIPPPTWGTRRACKFIVIAKPKLPVIVPFYSRIAGSRMCKE